MFKSKTHGSKCRYGKCGRPVVKDGLCKRCISNRKWKIRYPDKLKHYSWRHGINKRYGMSEEKYNALYKAQKGRCFICRQKETSRKHLSIDHNHKTGRIRGLLCVKCNFRLSIFEDSLWRKAATLYLRKAA